MILEELKRVLFRHKGVWIFLAMCIGIILLYIYSNRFYIKYDQYQIISECYIPFEGELTEYKLNELKNICDENRSTYYENGFAYDSLYSNAVSLMQQVDQPFLLYEPGWNSLIGNIADNYCVLTVLLIFSVLIFALDSGHKIRNLFNTSVNGRRRLLLTKVLIYTGVAFAVILIQGLIEYILAVCLIGMRHPEAPIQSILAFRDCSLNVTVIQGYIIVLFLRFTGAIMGGLFVGMIASLTRNIYISIISGIIIFFEGYFFSALYDCIYLLPQHLFVSYGTLTEGHLLNIIIVSAGIIFLLFTVLVTVNNERSRRRIV